MTSDAASRTVTVGRDVEAIRRDGYVVIEDVLGPAELEAARAALRPRFRRRQFGRNAFEGLKTERIYSLPAHARVFADLVEHPRILGICDAFLAPNYLLSAAQAIRIHPGEAPQALHYDDSFYPFPRPRAAISVGAIFAVDPFTTENGATEIIPGSHLWGDQTPEGVVSAEDFAQTMRYGRGVGAPDAPLNRRRGADRSTVATRSRPVCMPAGAAVVFLGTLWHRGGANRSAAPRLALTTQYCEPWARPQENFCLAVPRAVARALSERVQELLGYSIHPPFMGHVNGIHPRRMLGDT